MTYCGNEIQEFLNDVYDVQYSASLLLQLKIFHIRGMKKRGRSDDECSLIDKCIHNYQQIMEEHGKKTEEIVALENKLKIKDAEVAQLKSETQTLGNMVMELMRSVIQSKDTPSEKLLTSTSVPDENESFFKRVKIEK